VISSSSRKQGIKGLAAPFPRTQIPAQAPELSSGRAPDTFS
jgi:hypothetical protein